MAKNINFSLYPVYFEAIENGSKTTEYRSGDNDYWIKKLIDLSKYPGKSIDEVREGIVKGQLELYPIKYETCTFWTTKNGKRVHLVTQWRDTVMHKGHTQIAIRLGDVLLDSNGNKPKPKNR